MRDDHRPQLKRWDFSTIDALRANGTQSARTGKIKTPLTSCRASGIVRAHSGDRTCARMTLPVHADCVLYLYARLLQYVKSLALPALCSQKKMPLASRTRERHFHVRLATRWLYSQFSAPPVWYSVTRVSKKLRSFFRSIISLIHGNGFSSCANIASRPICWARRLAIKRR